MEDQISDDWTENNKEIHLKFHHGLSCLLSSHSAAGKSPWYKNQPASQCDVCIIL